jgi:hypothetical protein
MRAKQRTFISHANAGCLIAKHDLAGDSAGSALSRWLWRWAISFKKVWNDVLRDNIGDIVFWSTAGNLDGVIQICLEVRKADKEDCEYDGLVK